MLKYIAGGALLFFFWLSQDTKSEKSQYATQVNVSLGQLGAGTVTPKSLTVTATIQYQSPDLTRGPYILYSGKISEKTFYFALGL